ncbi:hypothetical protein, partial [Escherichia coli]|uniref:hypothetical protein n=1 Tax=Escherichia coli TaxID=562 RepID=UPI001BC8A12E
AGRTSDGNGSHASTLKSPSYTKSVSWQHYRIILGTLLSSIYNITHSITLLKNLLELANVSLFFL